MELDQVQENLFDDSEEIVEETPETKTEETTEEVPQAFLKVKYNGEEKELNEEDARTFAQKGMNYDKIYAPIERLARMNNMSVNDYMNQLNDTQISYEVSKEVDNLKSNPKYEGVNDEILEEIARSHVMDSINLQDRNFEEQQRGQADAQREHVQREIDTFMNEYPEFKTKGPESLDPKVFDYVKQGYTLLESYEKWLRENPSNKVKQQNELNKGRSLGNTTNAGNVETDDFLSGFMKG